MQVIPDKVNIFGREYNITVKELLDGSTDKEETLGQCLNDKLIIEIKKEQHPLLEADTLLHEIIHALDEVMQTRMSERQVCCIATGLIGVLKTNTEFNEYLYRMTR
jgi:hypothetical protein